MIHENERLPVYAHVSSPGPGVAGSCNGLQHYAALGLDAKGGAQVNLVPSPKPQDVYTGVCDVVKEKVSETASCSDCSRKATRYCFFHFPASNSSFCHAVLVGMFSCCHITVVSCCTLTVLSCYKLS